MDIILPRFFVTFEVSVWKVHYMKNQSNETKNIEVKRRTFFLLVKKTTKREYRQPLLEDFKNGNEDYYYKQMIHSR